VQDKLKATAGSVLSQFQLRHWKMVLKQVFFSAEGNMDK